MKTKQHNEAIKRMKKLKFHKDVLTEFEKGIIHKSETLHFSGVLFWLDDNEKQFINNWQKETGNLAYHVIKANTEIGIMYSILYVSKHEDEWVMDKEDILEGVALAYCGIGLDNDFFEYGSIGISPTIGGLRRTW